MSADMLDLEIRDRRVPLSVFMINALRNYFSVVRRMDHEPTVRDMLEIDDDELLRIRGVGPAGRREIKRVRSLATRNNQPENTAMTEKTLHNSDISGARTNVPDIKVVGNGDAFQLLCKASSQAEGWMKSTKAMFVDVGCIVQVTTQQKNPDGSYSLAEALTFVPGVYVVDDLHGGRKLSALQD